MPTENRRVATYLPAKVDERLEAFKNERGIKSDSQALVVILSEFLGLSQELSLSGSSPLADLIHHDLLEERLLGLKGELLSELDSRLQVLESSIEQKFNDLKLQAITFQRSETRTDCELPGELLDNLEPQTIHQSTEATQLQEDQVNSSPGSSLSNLLGDSVGSKDLTAIEDDSPVLVKRKRGRPKSSQSSKATSGTLSTAELAHRLKISSSTLSHWKPGGQRSKSSEDLLKSTREKDPDNVGWMYLPSINRFRPERELHSGLPRVLQSELLDISARSFNQVNPLPEGSERSEEG